MVETLLEDVRERLAESSKHIDQVNGVVNHACDNFVRKSKRAVKARRGASEDFVDQPEHSVRKYPKSAGARSHDQDALGILPGMAAGT